MSCELSYSIKLLTMNLAITEWPVKSPNDHEIHDSSQFVGGQALVGIGCTNMCETRYNRMWLRQTITTIPILFDQSPLFCSKAKAVWLSLLSPLWSRTN